MTDRSNDHPESLIPDEARRVTAALREWVSALDAVSDPIFMHDADGRILRANRAYAERAGMHINGPIGQLYWEIFPKMSGSRPLCSQSTNSGAVIEKEVTLDTGEIFLSRAFSVTRADKSFLCAIHVLSDVTERKRTEDALRESRTRFAELFENMSSGVAVYRASPDGKDFFFTAFNRAAEGLEKIQRESVLGRNVVEVFPGITEFGLLDVFRRVWRMGAAERHPISFYKDGRITGWRENYVYKLPSGEIVAIYEDVTTRKQAEEVLHIHKERLEELVQERTTMLQDAQRIGHIGSWKWDVSSGEISWSDEIYRIFGYQPGAFKPTYERFIATLHPDDVERIKQSEHEAFTHNRRHSIDHRIILPDGQVRWVHEEAVAQKSNDGQPLTLSGTVQDITERKITEQALVKAKEEAEHANLAKSEFLSRMSHELRTPMNAILGFAQVLEMEPITAEQQDFVREINKAGGHLLELINELLDLARIEAGRLPVTINAVKLRTVTEQATHLVMPLLKKNEVTLINTYAPDIEVLADATRLRQIMVNLLSNAAKYNRPGGRIQIDCMPISAERLRIAVTDTGQGIDATKRAKIFLPFERLGAEFTDVEGTGIGLALSKKVADLMGGNLGVESTPGQGSTFWLDLPRAQEHAKSEPMARVATRETLTSKINVLYIEDNAANLKVVEAMFRYQKGLTLLAATNGEYGLELAKRHRPEVILLDIHLPDIDGFAVLRELQSHPETGNIPVVALSADALWLDVEKGLTAGFCRYLTKPLKAQELFDAITGATSGARQFQI